MIFTGSGLALYLNWSMTWKQLVISRQVIELTKSNQAKFFHPSSQANSMSFFYQTSVGQVTSQIFKSTIRRPGRFSVPCERPLGTALALESCQTWEFQLSEMMSHDVDRSIDLL